MTAKKTTTGSSALKKKAAAKAKKKAPEMKAPAKKAAATAKKKASPKKKTAARPAKKKATPVEKKQQKTTAQVEPSARAEAVAKPKRSKGSVSSLDVTLGHVFALKPRVDKSFRQNDLSQARRSLANEVFANIAEATRAVVDEALAITRGSDAAHPERRRRR